MPTYDYRCAANGQIVEVSHRMSENISTWGELCTQAGVAAGDTPADSPVERLATGGNVIGAGGSAGRDLPPMPSCSTGSCCSGGMCGLG